MGDAMPRRDRICRGDLKIELKRRSARRKIIPITPEAAVCFSVFSILEILTKP
jgi:hypothetical protein